MISAVGVATLLLAFQGSGPARPAKELDPGDPASVVEHAAYATRTQKNYETAFKLRMQAAGAPLEVQGKGVWLAPGVLFAESTGSGGDDKKIVRVGNQAWVYDALRQFWPTAEQCGMDGAGRGIQNPDEILAVLSRNLQSAKFVNAGEIQLTLTGDDLARIVKQGGFLWNKSCARVDVTLDGEKRIRKVACDAALVTVKNDPVHYSAEVTFVSYNGAAELRFTDEKKRPIELSQEMRQAVDASAAGR